MKLIKSFNIGISTLVLVCCGLALLLFGWSHSGWKVLDIPTSSMNPDIPSGSLVLVHSVPVSSLKIGDVITHIDASDMNITLSHRIIKMYKIDGRIPAFITKGDANRVADSPIVGGDIIGKVLWHIPKAGRLLMDSKKPIVILPIIYIAALLIMIEEVQRLTEYFKLSQPYKLATYKKNKASQNVNKWTPKFVFGALTFVISMFGLGIFTPFVYASIITNTVSVSGNVIGVKSINPHKHQCTGTTNNNTTVNVNNSSTQTGTTGSATVTGNTSGGSATSGSVTNNNTTTTTITVTNC